MNNSFYPLILAAIFVLHNVEEYRSFDRMPKMTFGKNIMNQKSFLFSIILLSIVVVLFSVLSYFYKLEILTNVNIVVLFSLLINSMQHCLLSIRYKKMVAGTFSALFLMLPFSVLYFIRLFEQGVLNRSNCMVYIVVSPIVMVISIIATLRLGNYFFQTRR